MVSKNLGILKAGSDKYMKAGSELLKRLDKNEQSYVAAPWWFGFNASMHAAGPEFGLVASLKYQVQGERLVFVAPFDKLLQCFEDSLGDAKDSKDDSKDEISAQQVVDFFSEASDETLAKMKSYCFKVRIAPDSLFFLPWGWIALEKVMNGRINLGFRWLQICDQSNTAFISLVNKVLPANGKVKANSANAFLARIVKLLHFSGDALAAGPAAAPAPAALMDLMKAKVEQVDRNKAAAPAPKKKPVAR